MCVCVHSGPGGRVHHSAPAIPSHLTSCGAAPAVLGKGACMFVCERACVCLRVRDWGGGKFLSACVCALYSWIWNLAKVSK